MATTRTKSFCELKNNIKANFFALYSSLMTINNNH